MDAVTETTNAQRRSVFSRVLVGIDGSKQSREAARQAAILVDGDLTLLASYDVAPAIVAGTGTHVPDYFDEDLQRDAATGALGRAREDVAMASPTGKIVRGRAAAALISEVEREQDTLLVVGSHGLGRLAGFVMGSTATEVIHKAPCSVLVARRRSESDEFPKKVVVGVDGSPESAAAYGVARRLSERFNAELWSVVATGGKAIDRRLVDLIADRRREELPDEPVGALVAAAADADLLLVGSRGLHGLRALGSVSERVAHQAHSSVLVVRDPAWLHGSQERYDRERLELSTRDRVALANYTEIAEGRGTDHGGVLLDISHLDRELVLRRLPRMYRQFIDLAMLDITMRAVCSTAPRVPELVEDVLPVALDRLAGAA